MKVIIGEPNENIQGAWKSYEESHAATFHCYGFGKVEYDNNEILISLAMVDLYNKIKILENEDVFKCHAPFNYGRMFDRFAIKASVSLFDKYEIIGTFDYAQFSARVIDEGKFEDFFGRGEFPFVEVGIIHTENGKKFIVYFLSR